MANGHGGHRPGSGRKPKATVLRGLDGGAGHRATPSAGVASAPASVAAVEEFDAPDTLTAEVRLAWMEMAPHAFAARTLTKGTMAAFVVLCHNVVLERRYAASVRDAGSANHRGVQKLIQADRSAFSLRPCGKPIYEAEPVAAPAPQQKRAYW